MTLPVPVPDPRRKFLPIPDPTRGYTRTRSLPVRLPHISVKPMASGGTARVTHPNVI